MPKQSTASFRKHKMIHNWLVKNFPSCEVTYDGFVGIDHRIIFNEKITYIETKTCRRIIQSNPKRDEEKQIISYESRLGRFKFEKRNSGPYEKSQHHDLVDLNGWYIFVVGITIMAGLPAKDVKLTDTIGAQMVSWCNIVRDSHPNWLRYLKADVYGI